MSDEEEFRHEDGDVRTDRQIFYVGWKRGAEIESVKNGSVVNGELYRRVIDRKPTAL